MIIDVIGEGQEEVPSGAASEGGGANSLTKNILLLTKTKVSLIKFAK